MKRKSLVLLAKYVLLKSARRTRGSFPFRLGLATLTVLLLLRGWCSSAPLVTSFQDVGDCYTLSARYLQAQDEPYIIDSRLRSFECSWNFQGNTRKDFESWCKISGLRCGGRPYYVGFDSVWFNGEFMPGPRAAWLRSEQRKNDSLAAVQALKLERMERRNDSLLNLPPLPKKRVSLEYLELGKSTAEYLGFKYSDYIGRARFFDYEDLFSVTVQAQGLGDTSFVYRTYSSVYDSALTVFWGGLRDRLTSSNITSNGVISNNYVQESFGLTFRLDGLKYYYEHSTDYEHKISGSGLLTLGVNHIFGTYQYNSTVVSQVPFIGSVPGIGLLFRHTSEVTETRYIFISVYVSEVLQDGL